MTLRIGTRGSALALYQARTVAALLQSVSGAAPTIVVIKTSGDRLADAVLSEVGGKGLFVKEIEEALLAGEIDVAVHSSKDLPNELPPGLRLSAALPRADPRDAVVLPASGHEPCEMASLQARLGTGAVIGTSSVRRIAQLRRLFPGATFQPVRGNLDTRLGKLDTGRYHALVLAAAGLDRLGYGGRITSRVPLDVCVPAPGQGIIAIETRQGDHAESLVFRLHDGAAGAALTAERTVVARLGGGCQLPIGAHAGVDGPHLTLTATVIAPDSSREARIVVTGMAAEAVALGENAAEALLAQGAGEILAAVRQPERANESPS